MFWLVWPRLLEISGQIRGLQMQNLSGVTLERPAHLNHLAAFIDARQKAALLQPVMQSLLAHCQTIGPRQDLRDSIAGRWLQE